MTGINFDATVHLSDVVIFGGGVIAFFRVLIQQRDFQRDLMTILGKPRPPAERFGLMGDVENLKDRTAEHDDKLKEVRRALGYDRRRADHGEGLDE